MTDRDELPPDWSLRAVDDLIESRQPGYWGDSEATDRRPVPVLVVRNGDLDEAGHRKSAAPRFFGVREAERSRLAKGDILLTTSGQVGKVYLVAGDIEMLRPSNFTRRIRPRASEVDAEYLFLTFFSAKIRAALQQHAHGSTIRNLNASFFAERLIPLPPLPEQRAIAGILRTVQRAKEATDQVIAASRELARSLGQRVFHYGLAPLTAPAEEVNWPAVSLAEVAAPDRPICYGILMPGPNIEGGVLYVKVRDYPDGTVQAGGLLRTSAVIAEQYRRSTLRGGDVLVSIRGTTGRVAIVPEGMGGANITQDTARVTVDPRFDRDYIALALRSSPSQSYIREWTRGAAVKGINLRDLRQLSLPLPPRPIQSEIAGAQRSVESKISAELGRSAALDILFKALMGDLMTGRVRVAQFDPIVEIP